LKALNKFSKVEKSKYSFESATIRTKNGRKTDEKRTKNWQKRTKNGRNTGEKTDEKRARVNVPLHSFWPFKLAVPSFATFDSRKDMRHNPFVPDSFGLVRSGH
jgi:hypothetical protein